MKWIKHILVLLLLFSFITPIHAVSLQDNGQFCNDDAGILSSSTENEINQKGKALDEKSGAQIVVVTVDYTDNQDIEDYAYDLFNDWGLGDKKKNNGVLILIVAQQNDYWVMQGRGIENVVTTSFLSDVVYDNDFNDMVDNHTHYDQSVLGAFNDIYDKLDSYYGSSYTSQESNQGGILVPILIGFIVLVILLSAFRPRRKRYYHRPYRPYYHDPHMPPPPPPHFGGRPPRPMGRPMGGPGPSRPRSSGSRMGGGSSFSSRGSTSRSSGGGSSRGGGVGRH